MATGNGTGVGIEDSYEVITLVREKFDGIRFVSEYTPENEALKVKIMDEKLKRETTAFESAYDIEVARVKCDKILDSMGFNELLAERFLKNIDSMRRID